MTSAERINKINFNEHSFVDILIHTYVHKDTFKIFAQMTFSSQHIVPV